MRSVLIFLILLFGVSVSSARPANPVEVAKRNARHASEALWRSNRVAHAWLDRADSVTGLLPRRGNDPGWTVKDSAADLYPFIVIASYFTEPSLYEGAMLHLLRQETLLSTRIGRLSDDLLAGGKGYVYGDVDLNRIIFGSSEYMKDGLIPITELLGQTPWYYRMIGIATDIIRHAPYRTSRGQLPAQSAEVNGNMLQVLSRLTWKTSNEEYLNAVMAIADCYFLDILPSTNYIPPDVWDVEQHKPVRPIFRFSDHGNEIIGGLSEAYLLLAHKKPDKATQYRNAFVRMIDKLLELGRNADGVWFTSIDPESGKVVDERHVHCWGYMYNAIYTAYMITGDEKYKSAVVRAIEAVTRNPRYLFDEEGAGRGWGANAYSDSLESALVLLNRLPNPAAEKAIDVAMKKMLDRQKDNGIVEDWYGDGNYIRTAMMWAFWKTQGSFLAPWNRRVHLGAEKERDHLLLHISAETPWLGLLRFDHMRHRNNLNLGVNYPRLNEFPEWFTVEHDHLYKVQINDGERRDYLGADLIAGIRLAVDAGQEMIVRIFDGGPAAYGNQKKTLDRTSQ